jgi:hypothetical protein
MIMILDPEEIEISKVMMTRMKMKMMKLMMRKKKR